MKDGAEIVTDLDLSNVDLLIPRQTMKDIGLAYRPYRHAVIMSKRQLTLEPMPPLKAETVKRKAGIHVSATKERYGRMTARAGSKKFKREGKVSMYPDVPLVDTGNMVAPNSLDMEVADGSLVLRQGVTRAEVAAFHQYGGAHLPQRVHLSWNQEFIDQHVVPLIQVAIERALNAGRRTRVA